MRTNTTVNVSPKMEINVNSKNRQTNVPAKDSLKKVCITISGIVVLAFLIYTLTCLRENAQAFFLVKEVVMEYVKYLLSL